jgi:hypothetical protein
MEPTFMDEFVMGVVVPLVMLFGAAFALGCVASCAMRYDAWRKGYKYESPWVW